MVDTPFARAARLKTAAAASLFLAGDPLSPVLLRLAANRVDELRFTNPRAALEISEIVLKALDRVKGTLRRPALEALCWGVFGSSCRGVHDFSRAEIALWQAAGLARDDRSAHTRVMRRVAYLCAAQRHREEARNLIGCYVADLQRVGGLRYARALVAQSAILGQVGYFAGAAVAAKEALINLPHNGDRYHLSAISNLANSRLDQRSSLPDLQEIGSLIAHANKMVVAGTLPAVKLRWIGGKLLRRQGHLQNARVELEAAYEGHLAIADALERALLVLDLAEVQLELDDATAASKLALGSFSTLADMRQHELDAYQAFLLFHKAASENSLDRDTVRRVRDLLLACR